MQFPGEFVGLNLVLWQPWEHGYSTSVGFPGGGAVGLHSGFNFVSDEDLELARNHPLCADWFKNGALTIIEPMDVKDKGSTEITDYPPDLHPLLIFCWHEYGTLEMWKMIPGFSREYYELISNRIQVLKNSGAPQFVGLKDRAFFGMVVNNVVEKVLASGDARINAGIRHATKAEADIQKEISASLKGLRAKKSA